MFFGFFEGSVDYFNWNLFPDFFIDPTFDFSELFWGHLTEVIEVKAEIVVIKKGAGLVDLRTEDILQDLMQEVRSGLVIADQATTRTVYSEMDLLSNFEWFESFNGMEILIIWRMLGIYDLP